MKRKVFIALLAAMAMNVFAQNFTIKGRFTDVCNDTLLISYTMREPDKKVIDVKVPIDEVRCSRTAISRPCSLCRMKASR